MKKITIILITLTTLTSCVTQGGLERSKQYKERKAKGEIKDEPYDPFMLYLQIKQ
jgi:hypothetical protein|tara:strand:- start:106 stop:270 length:165 start_codon:yes stop_codon:yes gene_type:complete